MSQNAKEAGKKVDQTADKLKQDASNAAAQFQKTAEQKRGEIDDAGSSLINDITKGAEGFKDAAGEKIKQAREQIADATKPDEK